MFNSYKEIDIKWLKKNCLSINAFGLGFTQVKINPEYRLHFYDPELLIVADEEPHNHRYGFGSRILKGKLQQDFYSVQKYNAMGWEMVEETCKEGDKIEQPPVPCSVKKIATNAYSSGSTYYIDKDTFHTVLSDKSITLLQREKPEKDTAQVVYKIEYKNNRVCPFSQKIEEEILWEMVEKSLRDNF